MMFDLFAIPLSFVCILQAIGRPILPSTLTLARPALAERQAEPVEGLPPTEPGIAEHLAI
jgi:hypothetical protein